MQLELLASHNSHYYSFVVREQRRASDLASATLVFGASGAPGDQFANSEEQIIMKFSSIVMLLGGLGIGILGAPSAAAAPDCSPDGVNATVSSVTGAAQQYLSGHPGANQVVTAAYGQPRGEAAANIRGYFTAHPNEYYDLRGILSPIGETERQCNVKALPANLESAYHEFMAG